ncbi:1-acyl-sn-glycerol-3-phosphate acyltransferase [Reichenbachiella carrageenanivorans]|uniref:Glycerol-3-phosphate acyltransferase n=1 Tax=Reichenbachiella carrageenanivorans TaxID=2979869 RepID=A0ABY6CW17_9BACT|nr:1-acyl-sn-glycerol-3-phosphate acyltransferase [Reichenbachiella carrageenanivorans]UXX77904.1 1-acyl-sn-glycerol-3-phosphate acyltransferase [Reichenbachiella carrageenanivorans]
MAKKRDEFIQLVVEESFDNMLLLKRGRTLREEIEMTAYREKQRAKNHPWKVDPKDDYSFWDGVQQRVVKLDGLGKKEQNDCLKDILREILNRYGNEIAGNFNPSHYHVARAVVTLGFGRLLNAARVKGPWSLFSNQLDLDDKIHIKGEVDQLRKLAKLGTVVMVPTHFSNIDSVLIGWIIQFLGLPPFIYGAGLNLFNLKVFSYFMNSVGAYKVDRRKKNSIYLECLKSYSTIALREGCHSLFFPGGTRSRSGRIEKALKLGLLGTTIEAQRQIFQFEENPEEKKIFIVPVTLNYHFVLEAPSLINDYLKSKGQERYYEENDEFTTSFKISTFLMKFFTKGSDISVSIGNALDVLGNEVNINGRSLDKNGNEIDLKDYFKSNGEVTEDAQREQEYNRILGKKIVQEFHKHNRVFSSHLVAFTAFRILERKHTSLDLYGLLRLSDEELILPYEEYKEGFSNLLDALRAMKDAGSVGLADHLSREKDEVIKHGIKNLGMYHAQPPLKFSKSGDVVIRNMNLLYYYHNRLDGYELEKYL